MRRFPLLATLLGLALAASCGPAAGGEPGGVLFRGTQASDRAATIAGVRQSGLRCSGCHGRDASGRLAGSAIIPPVDGPTLRSPTPGRPPYDAALFARALREGLGSDGRLLALAMPRYAFDAAESQALWRFLSGIGAEERRGVGPDRVRFAVAARPESREPAEALRRSLERAWRALGSPAVNGRRAEFVALAADPSSGAFDDVFAVLGSEPGMLRGSDLLDALVARGVPVVGPAHLPSRDQERLPGVLWLTRGESAVATFIAGGGASPRDGGIKREHHVISAGDLAETLALPPAELKNARFVVSIFAIEAAADLQRLTATGAETRLVRPVSPFGSRDRLADLLARLARDGLADSGRDLSRARFLDAVARLVPLVSDPATGAPLGQASAADFDIIRLEPRGPG